MALRQGFEFPSLKNVAIGVIGTLFLIQIISLLVSAVFPAIDVVKGGNMVLMMLLAVGVMTLFVVGTNVERLQKKESLVFVIIVLGLIALAYWKLPTLLPQIFSIEPEISQAIKNSVGSIFGGF